MAAEAYYGEAMLRAGAADFVSKTAHPDAVVAAIRTCGLKA
jgi:DNA-binding NarL/FixJ family response regulator